MRATPEELASLADRLGHSFQNMSYLESAITHPSSSLVYASRFERLEFLGDRVLGLVVAEWLADVYPDEDEGTAQIRHAELVRQTALTAVGEGLKLTEHVVGARKAYDTSGVVADAVEAVVGAAFSDGGYESAKPFVLRAWAPLLKNMTRNAAPQRDAKTRLQEFAQRRRKPLPNYECVRKTGPDHNPEYTIRCDYDECTATAKAKGKKPTRRAEIRAAEKILEQLKAKEKGNKATSKRKRPPQ